MLQDLLSGHPRRGARPRRRPRAWRAARLRARPPRRPRGLCASVHAARYASSSRSCSDAFCDARPVLAGERAHVEEEVRARLDEAGGARSSSPRPAVALGVRDDGLQPGAVEIEEAAVRVRAGMRSGRELDEDAALLGRRGPARLARRRGRRERRVGERGARAHAFEDELVEPVLARQVNGPAARRPGARRSAASVIAPKADSRAPRSLSNIPGRMWGVAKYHIEPDRSAIRAGGPLRARARAPRRRWPRPSDNGDRCTRALGH